MFFSAWVLLERLFLAVYIERILLKQQPVLQLRIFKSDVFILFAACTRGRLAAFPEGKEYDREYIVPAKCF